MRNRYASGHNMLATNQQSMPKLQRQGKAIPLIGTYAIEDANSLSVFVLNRCLGGTYNGQDFGNGTIPVTLHLPWNKASKITRYRLEHPNSDPADPRANNLDNLNVVIGSQTIAPSLFNRTFKISPTTGGVEGGMPAGNIYLYVFQKE